MTLCALLLVLMSASSGDAGSVDAGVATLMVEFPEGTLDNEVFIDGSQATKYEHRGARAQQFVLLRGTHLVEGRFRLPTALDHWVEQRGVAQWVAVVDSQQLIVAPPFTEVAGTVTHAGVPVVGAQVSIENDDVAMCHAYAGSCERLRRSRAVTTTGDGGSFQVSVQGAGSIRVFAHDDEVGTFVGRIDGGTTRLRLELTSGVTVALRAAPEASRVVLFLDEPDDPPPNVLLVASVIDGGAIFRHLAGHFRVRSGSSTAVVDATIPRAIALGVDQRYAYLSGVVSLDGGPPFRRGSKSGVCAEEDSDGGNVWCGALGEDGNFRLAVERGHRYRLEPDSSRYEPIRDVTASAGETVAVELMPWRTRIVKVTALDGGPVDAFWNVPYGAYVDAGSLVFERRPFGGQVIEPAGFVPVALAQKQFRAIDINVRAAPLPVTGSVRSHSGAPVVGAAVALLCRGDAPEANARWQNVVSDVGPTWSATYWPEGVRCVNQVTHSDASGSFSFAKVDRPIYAVEVHVGDRSQRIDYKPDVALNFVLGD